MNESKHNPVPQENTVIFDPPREDAAMSDPVAALYTGMDADGAVRFHEHLATLAEQGYVLVNAEGLARALVLTYHEDFAKRAKWPTMSEWRKDAAAILAAIQEQTDE